MVNKCDNTSVGMLVRKNSDLLLIERKLPPFGFSPPAGHVDDHGSFEEAAIVELKEEVGLDTETLNLVIEGRLDSSCRREGGSWHYWKIYEVEVSGSVIGSDRETKQVGWYDEESIRLLGERTEDFKNGKITDDEWEQSPGIGMAWFYWFKRIGIL